jgi:putative oxidoreductase
MQATTPRWPLIVLRVGVALLLGIHGVHRATQGGVAPFGAFLDGVGFPFGVWIARAITGFEVIAAIALAAGWWTRVVVCGFSAILLGGIALVHAQAGWFVVGAGRNGVEFSVLLLLCLAVLFATAGAVGRR